MRPDDLSPIHLDVLREIGNIGQGNAATALAAFSRKLVTIDVPCVRILDINEAAQFLGGPENVVTAICVRLKGDISGMMLTIMEREFVSDLIRLVFGAEPDDLYAMDDLQNSFVQEIGNILSGSYLNAVSAMSGMSAEVTVPSVATDMVGAILAVPAVECAALGTKVMFIEDSFTFADGFDENERVSGSAVRCNMILVPQMSSLEMLFDRLKV
ncbi:MAG: chemotaxis protein CheC [Oscillospiraceae bacterium]|nr:chemotaxis protein CheC [Oscillospiraceae bacterium]MBQ8978326.1 chemotaxis protein CheC [Oscillospiraceae bacterium]